jgi:transposase-like protein
MKRLSPDGKTAIIMQAINRGSRAIAEIAALNNIGKSTLTRWVRQYKLGILPESKPSESNVVKDNKPLNAEQKFRHILASNGLDDAELGKYCRQNGLYAHELTTWKNTFINDQNKGDNAAEVKAEHTELKAKNTALEKELRRKDKALAEASALLILKKKANLIWGESGDD